MDTTTSFFYAFAVILIILGIALIYFSFDDEGGGKLIFIIFGLGCLATGIEIFSSAQGVAYGITWLTVATAFFVTLTIINMKEGGVHSAVWLDLVLALGFLAWLGKLLYPLIF